MPTGAHQAFPGAQFAGVLRLGPLNFRRHDSGHDRASDLIGHFVLDSKNVFEPAVVTIGPDVMSIACLYQLRADADAIPGFPDTALEHITDAKIASHLANVDRLTPVGEGGITCDDE
jgi:hypothetical protein